ncbi:YhgE/Pip family protein [Rhodococcus spongiicola]|uniref:DUF3533 domain-containing protein n=1 Tax=Rhodococcus spongiicola TaxID=2487352 RepID=A0A438B1L3_9NOCA|nr:YhgE/Pip family protein [Rhodococcus spongiicola]RVW04827.1 DUF3533 domain-containing protein [Rhodococcus spongiicola]
MDFSTGFPGRPGASARRPHTVRSILAILVIAPLAIAAFYMWALWNPGDTVNRLPVAIVNSDVGAEVDGTPLEVGDEVVAALVESGDVDWKVVTAEQAREGVDDGTYYYSVVIPETFSADVASAATGDGRKAKLEVVYNDFNSLVATPVGESVIAQVRSAVSESVGEQSVDEVLIGLGELGEGFGEAAAGAQELSDGASEALAGANEAYAGSQELAAGAVELSAGADQAAAGSGELSAGMNELVEGTDLLGDGARQISEVVDMVTGPILSVMGEQGDIAAQLVELRDGARELAYQLTDPSSDYRGGVLAATAGAAELDAGLGELAAGAQELRAGAGELSSGLGQLATGMGQLDSGSVELAVGLTEGVAQVPQFTEEQRLTTAGLLASPVAVDEVYAYPAAGFGPGAVPAVMSVLLFLVGILIWFVVRPRRGPVRQLHDGVIQEGLRRYRIPAAVALVAALVASVVSLVVADVDPPSVLAMIAVMILVGAAAVAAGRVFTVVLGAVNGTFVALGALMIQIFTFGAVYPIEQLPAPVQWIHSLMPLTWAHNSMRMVLVGYYGPRFWIVVFALAALVVGAAAFTIWWRRRQEPEVEDVEPLPEPSPELETVG